jgi:atypical dual specificity phosphatase
MLLVAAKNNQQKATTYLTHKDGSRWRVERDLQGNEIVTPVVSFRSQFFVIDEKPDTEVCTVAPGLHIGSQDAATNVQSLQEKGVTHILNVAFYITNPFDSQFICETIEVADEPGANITALFPRCFEFIDSARQAGGGVLVHCNAGISRSSSVVAGYLMQTEGYSLDEALAIIRSARPVVKPNDGFMTQLRQFETTVHKHA